MNTLLHELTKNNSLTTKLIFATALLLAASTSTAGDASAGYVDSVHKWGAWGLDLEPAAGGLTQPRTQALNTRNSKVVLRTNSIAALAPPTIAAPEVPIAPVTPPPPVIPIIPPPVAPPAPPPPTTFAPPGATPIVNVTLPPIAPPAPAAPSAFAPPGATPINTVTLP